MLSSEKTPAFKYLIKLGFANNPSPKSSIISSGIGELFVANIDRIDDSSVCMKIGYMQTAYYEYENITLIELSHVKELMSDLHKLANVHVVARELELTCAAAITAFKETDYEKYYEYLFKIIRVGEDICPYTP